MNALLTLVSITGIVVVLFWLWPAYRVDRYRYDLFMLRDRLFDLACDGTLAFSDPAYRDARQRLNGMIFMADRVHWLVIALPHFSPRKRRRSEETVKPSGYPNLSDEARAALESIERENHLLMWLHMLYSSPLFLITMLPSFAFIIGVAGSLLIGQRFKNWVAAQSLAFDGFLWPIDDAARRLRIN